MSIYQCIFGHLLKLTRVEEAMNRVFFVDTASLRTTDHSIFIAMKMEFRCFLCAFIDCMYTQTIQRFDQFLNKVRQIEDGSMESSIKEIYQMHFDCFNHIKVGLYLDDKIVLDNIDCMLQLVLTFSRLSCGLVVPVSARGEKVLDYEELFKRWKECKEKFTVHVGERSESFGCQLMDSLLQIG